MHSIIAACARWQYRRGLNVDWSGQQERALRRCIALGRTTRFALDFELEPSMTISDYQLRVPLWNYLDFHKAYVDEGYPSFGGILTPKPVKYVASSSGTTGGMNKYYPFPPQTLNGFKRTAAAQVLATVARLGHVRPFMRPYLNIADMTPLRDIGAGVRAGLVTRILSDCAPWIAKRLSVNALDTHGGANAILDVLVERAVRSDLGVLTGLTHWLLQFIERAKLKTGKERVRDIWPHLQVIGHGGVPSAVYHDALHRAFEETEEPFIFAESYASSEGYIAYGDPMLGGALRLSSSNGIFYEFIPVEDRTLESPRRVLASDVEENREYIVAVTTTSGLWSHILGDIVKFTDRSLKTLVVVGRAWGSIDTWNEHAGESDIDGAFREVTGSLDREAKYYHVGPYVYPSAAPRGRYRIIIEYSDASADGLSDAVAVAFDNALKSINKTYRRVREEGGPVDLPEVHLTPQGFFESWMDERPGGGFQRKVPRVEGTGKVAAELVARLQS